MSINKRLQSIAPSATLAISALAKKMQAEGIPVIGFGAGEPDFDTPDYIKEAGMKAIREGFTRYTASGGTDELKKAICQKLLKDQKLTYQPNQIVVSCGAKHTIYNLIQALCNEGDEVIIPAPYWLSYPEMVKMAGAVSVAIPTSEKTMFKITPDMLKKTITPRTRVFILNSPSNPTGMMYTRKELEALGAELVKHNITIISDEIYEKIVYDNHEHVSIASLSEELYKKTVVVNGHSKVYAMTGWRIGYMAGPADIAKAVDILQSHSTSNPCSISQKAATVALTGPQDFLNDKVKLFQQRRDRMVSMLRDISGITCEVPHGAFYVLANIVGLNKGKSMAVTEILLKEAQVAVVPGDSFGADDYIRLSYAMDVKDIEEGLCRIAKWRKGEHSCIK